MRLDHLLSKEYIQASQLLYSVLSGLGIDQKQESFLDCGALAQLGERLLCTQEVSGSIPLGSIVRQDVKIT